jgi:hypothetical protein
MPRLSVDRLPPARTKYRKGVRASIETVGGARAEDRTRARKLRHEIKIGTDLIDEDRARQLVRMLKRSADSERVSKTLASSRYMRKQRLRLGSSLWQYVDGLEEPFTTFTLISSRWTTLGEDLRSLDPVKLLQGVRSDLNRAGASEADGSIFMGLDGTYDLRRSVFQPHIHGLATGSMIEVVDGLRRLKKFKPVKAGTAVQPPIHRPIQVRRAQLVNLPHPLTYLMKSYWACPWHNEQGTASSIREGHLVRIPEPFHSDWLIWLDRWRLSELTLMMGMYVGCEGFALSGC